MTAETVPPPASTEEKALVDSLPAPIWVDTKEGEEFQKEWVKLLYISAKEEGKSYFSRAREQIEPIVSNLFGLMDQAVNTQLRGKVSSLQQENRTTKDETQRMFQRLDRVLKVKPFDDDNSVNGIDCRSPK